MFRLAHQNHVGWLYIMVLLLLFLDPLKVTPARADVGVQPILPGGSSIQPESDTPIVMASEVVSITVRESTTADNNLVTLTPDYYGKWSLERWYPAIAEVTADFEMFNPTSQAHEMLVWFPLASAVENVDWELNAEEIIPHLAAFRVFANGSELEYSVIELPNPKGNDKLPLPWAYFTVRFAADDTTNLRVEYQVPLTPAIKGNEMILYYIFQTGAGWAGTIGQADLIVNLPFPASVETLSGMAPTGLHLPYYSIPQHGYDLPAGAVMEGNQVRWTWTDFEPGPDDDFAIWLLLPGRWQMLEATREQVRVHPQDGEAWLELAELYHLLSVSHRNTQQTFSASYLPQGIEAYAQAKALLPDHPRPHAGWALLTLVPYLSDGEKPLPPALLAQIEEELDIARELGVQYPELVPDGVYGSVIEMLEAALFAYSNRQATQTADREASQTMQARQTMDPTRSRSLTPTPCVATNTPTKKASATLQATATPLVVPMENEPNTGFPLLVIGAAAALAAVIAWFLRKQNRPPQSG